MDFFFSEPKCPGKSKAKQRKIKYILYKCIQKHNVIAENDAGN